MKRVTNVLHEFVTGLPRVTRVDPGTENLDIEISQEFLRRNHNDSIARGRRMHWICKSQLNQVRCSDGIRANNNTRMYHESHNKN